MIRCSIASPPGAYLADFAPDGRSLAVAVPQFASAVIERISVDGRDLGPLATSFDSPPKKLLWSPDGRQLAWLKRTEELDVVVPSTGVTRRLVPAPQTQLHYTELDGWSADGSTVLYTRGDDPNNSSLYLLDVATDESRRLVGGRYAAWSPDGTWIAFIAPDLTANRNEVLGSLDVIHPDGTGLRTLVHAPALYDLVWSPDSTQIVYEWAIDVESHIRIVSVAGGPVRDLTEGIGPLFWAPTGIFLAGLQPDLPPYAFRVDPATGAKHGFAHTFSTVAAVAPDGKTVAYAIANPQGNPPGGIRLVDYSGKDDRPLLDCSGTPGPDRVIGTRLGDVIDVRGGGVDSVVCGRGYDVVYADRRDYVARDCERVIRSGGSFSRALPRLRASSGRA